MGSILWFPPIVLNRTGFQDGIQIFQFLCRLFHGPSDVSRIWKSHILLFLQLQNLQPYHDRCCDLLRTLSYFNSGVQFKETGSVQLPTPRHFMILSCVSEQGEQTDCLMICCRCLQMWSHQIDVVH